MMMIPGIIMKKCKLAGDGFGKGLSNLVLYIAQPSLVFLAYIRPYDAKVLINSIYVLVLSVVVHLIFVGVASLFFKRSPDAERRMLRFATIFSNAAFMGIPVITAVLGAEATIYASIYNITYNVFLWSVGVHICTADKDADGDGVDDREEIVKKEGVISFKKVLFHPVTIAAALGLIFFITPLDAYMPKFADESFTMLKNLVAPLSMVVIGLRLAEIDIKGFFNKIDLYVFLVLRHIALPFVILGVIKLVELFGIVLIDDVSASIIIMAAAPAAASLTMFAEMYDCDAVYGSKLVVVSTVLSLLTMPIVCLFV